MDVNIQKGLNYNGRLFAQMMHTGPDYEGYFHKQIFRYIYIKAVLNCDEYFHKNCYSTFIPLRLKSRTLCYEMECYLCVYVCVEPLLRSYS